jgi:hypothetical protein
MLEGVTPGPWAADILDNVWGKKPGSIGKIANLAERPQAAAYDHIPEHEVTANARFIAWAREAVPALAARVADLAKGNRELTEQAVAALNRAEAAETKLAASEALVEKLREALRGALWRMEQYDYQAMQPQIVSARAALQGEAFVPADPWRDISTAPKDDLIDIWLSEGKRWCDCYYDRICDEWRTSRPGGRLVSVKAHHVTHWMPRPAPPYQSQPTEYEVKLAQLKEDFPNGI